jgi:hypothetical protein
VKSLDGIAPELHQFLESLVEFVAQGEKTQLAVSEKNFKIF